jgi:hypothetical protein
VIVANLLHDFWCHPKGSSADCQIKRTEEANQTNPMTVIRFALMSFKCPATPKSAEKVVSSLWQRRKREPTQLGSTSFIEEDVASFDVSVDLLDLVKVLQTFESKLAYHSDLLLIQWAFENTHDVSNRTSRAVLHHDLLRSG